MTGVSECSQQRGNLKDNGYIMVRTNSNHYQLITKRRKSKH
ncbi:MULTISPECIES: hypothetical protein [Photorhabdus]|uniref:50S ribosomal protein L36 n=1 Tax=Photorhabdus bodei TaxID=2029681 RepID=A0AAW6BEH4_9GAMM|nr:MULTISPECIES: hypothetical protein [Photorhabdus]MDB6371095.1 hypothetical protein [Photorhabdus bodei]